MSVYVKVNKSSGKPNKKRRGKFDKSDVDIELEKAIKIFKKKVKNSKILKIYHEKMYFVKPSEKKRTQKLMARYRAQQQTLENRDK